MIAPAFRDGMLTSDAKGRVCRVFDPPWWAVWRWIGWLCRPADAKTIESRASFVFDEGSGLAMSGRLTIRPVRLVVEAERAS